MNIDSPSLFSLLTSVEGSDVSPQLVLGDDIESIDSKGFSDALMAKVAQIQSSNETGLAVENLAIENLNTGNELHKLAGINSGNDRAIDFSDLFGKGLPQGVMFEKEIDLENTLEALANVLNTLEEPGQQTEDLNAQITTAIEQVKSIKAAVNIENDVDIISEPVQEQVVLTAELEQAIESVEMIGFSEENSKLEAKLDEVVDDEVMGSVQENSKLETESDGLINVELMDLTQENLKLEVELDAPVEGIISPVKTGVPGFVELNQKLDEIVEKLEVLKENSSMQAEINTEHVLEVAGNSVLESEQLKQLDNMVSSLDQIKRMASNETEVSIADDVEEKIQQLVINIESIKDIVFKKGPFQANKQLEETPLDSIEESDNEADVENKMALLMTSLRGTKSSNSAHETPVFQEIKPGLNKESLSLKQMAEERLLNSSIKPDSETTAPILPDTESSKSIQKDPALFAKQQNEKNDLLDSKQPELNTEKASSKFATDIANLNRAVMIGSKTEVAPMTKHFSHPEWNKEIGERVVWMHKQAIPSAELRLNPGHLGPITIKVDVSQDQATVAFTAQHAAVKEAIDAALPKLREMFSAQQLNLGEVSVSQEDAGQKQPKGFSQMGSDSGKGDKQNEQMAENEQSATAMDITDEIEAGRAIESNGLLSIFA